MIIQNFLNEVQSLGEMTEEEQLRFLSFSTIVELKAKKTILKQGSICTKIWFLLSGSIRMYRIEDKKDITLHLFIRNRFFTDLVALKEQIPSLLQIETIEPTVLIAIDAADLHNLFDSSLNCERIGRKLYQQLLYEETSRLHDLLYRNATQRYVNMLKIMPNIFQHIPQKHIASYLNIRPETLSRIRKNNL